MSGTNLKIDYVEFYTPEAEQTRAFFASAFGWDFTAYGPTYHGIENAGLDGGVEAAPHRAPLVILRTDDLAAVEAEVLRAGGEITKPAFDFPGGRRFQFREPGGTEMAVWSKGD